LYRVTKSELRIVLGIILGGALALYLLVPFTYAISPGDVVRGVKTYFGGREISRRRPSQQKYCFDFAGVLPQDVVRNIDDYGKSLKEEFDIDFIVIVTASIDGKGINTFAADIFSRWEIGRSTRGRKGILILIAQKEQKVKIEVGYDLEHIYTDIYVARVEREMLEEFLAQADWKRGFLATIESFIERAYRMQDKGINVKEVTGAARPGYYSGGAGAKGTFDFGAALNKPLPQTQQGLRKYFGAQPTPELTFQRYMEFCARNMKDYTVDLFNDRTKVFFSYWPTASGQRHSEAEEWDGLSYEVRQKGKWAAVFHPDADYMKMAQHPVYLIEKTHKGWQMDLDAMARGLSYGGRFVHWVNGAWLYPYIELFMDDYTLMPNTSCLIRKKTDVGTFGIYFLGTSLYNPAEPGVHIGVWEKTQDNNRGKLRTGDSIVSIDGKKVPRGREGERMVARYLINNVKTGGRHHLRIWRGWRFIELDVEAQRIGNDSFSDFRKCLEVPRVWMGVYIGMTNEEEEKYVDGPSTVILDVCPGSPADKAGLKPGDIIYKVGGKRGPYGELLPGQFLDIVRRHKTGDKLKLEALRNLKERKVVTVILEETEHRGYY